MNFLQYKSDEMFSSTQLIRKSKMIFDNLSNDHIDKAVILRDGKPSFLLMDFAKYERIMQEYMELKNAKGTEPASHIIKEKKIVQKSEPQKSISALSNEEKLSDKEQKELNAALEELENLDMSDEELKKEELKEFWD